MRFVSYVSLYLCKAFSSLLHSPSCFSQLIRKFHSCLSPLLPACPCALGVSVSRQQSLLWCSPITLSFPNTSTTTNFFALSVTHNYFCSCTIHSRQTGKSIFVRLTVPPPAQEEGAHARPWGASMLPSPYLYPNSVPNPN